MTTMAPEQQDTVEVDPAEFEDLELLDDEHDHLVCLLCQIMRTGHAPELGQVVYTVCGRRVLFIHRGPKCPECLQIQAGRVCPACGGFYL